MAVVDAHLHLTDRASLQYLWTDDMPALATDFTPAVFAAEASGTGVAGAVFVECSVNPDWAHRAKEAAWACAQAALPAGGAAGVRGVVAAAPLGVHRREPTAAYLQGIAHPCLRGVRSLIQGEKAGFASSELYREGCEEAAKLGLSVDLCIKSEQIGEVDALVASCPGTRFVLDHMGKPVIRKDGAFDEAWARGLEAVARHANVHCKISGVITEVEDFAWTPELVAPYVNHAIKCFGWSRVMYGSDWFVSKLATPKYGDWLDVLRALPVVAAATAEERALLFTKNVEAFYKL